MDDDIVFCAKTGRQIVGSQNPSTSNVIPFPRRPGDRPKPCAESYAEQVTTSSTATRTHVDALIRDDNAAPASRFDKSDDI